MAKYAIYVTGVATIVKEGDSEQEAMDSLTKEDLRNIDWDNIEADYAEELNEDE